MREGIKNIEKEKFELKKLEFEKSLELRNFEIDKFWRRGWFFGALLVALVTGCLELKGDDVTSAFSIYLAFLAFLVSLAQSLMNRGSKYWQERWEYKTKNKESALGIDVTKTNSYHNKERYYIDASIRAKGENPIIRSARFSVSKAAILVWDIITISCLLLWINEWPIFKEYDNNCCRIFVFHGFIILYLLIVLLWRHKYNFYESLLKDIKEDHPTGGDAKHKLDCNIYVDNKVKRD